jgi:hypothetical protein
MIHFNIIIQSMHRSSQWSFLKDFLSKILIRASLYSHACYTPYPSYPSSFHHHNNVWRDLQIIKHFFTRFSRTSCYFIPLCAKTVLSQLFSRTRQPTFFPSCEKLCKTILSRDRVSVDWTHTQVVTTSNYNRLTRLHTLRITVTAAHIKSCLPWSFAYILTVWRISLSWLIFSTVLIITPWHAPRRKHHS